MKIFLLFLVASAFATTIATTQQPPPPPRPSSADWLNGLDKFISKYLPFLPAYQKSQNENYPPIEYDVTFRCVKPFQIDLVQVNFKDSNVTSKLDFSKPINFIIHGWLGNMEQSDVEIMYKRDVLKWARYGDCNACIVDWSRLAMFNYSTAATKHVRMVADFTVIYMQFLVQHGMDIEQVSIVGFSLGAQIAGFIGQSFLQQRLAAIYGLDPAGPGFTMPEDYGIYERLDRTDASYVQCIFTNQYILGTGIDCGHSNFFLNGGMTQPGCAADVICSHKRAHDYFSESFNPKRIFDGENCENWNKKFFLEFIAQRCSDEFDQIGIHTARKRGRFFVKTNSQPPFARHRIEDVIIV